LPKPFATQRVDLRINISWSRECFAPAPCCTASICRFRPSPKPSGWRAEVTSRFYFVDPWECHRASFGPFCARSHACVTCGTCHPLLLPSEHRQSARTPPRSWCAVDHNARRSCRPPSWSGRPTPHYFAKIPNMMVQWSPSRGYYAHRATRTRTSGRDSANCRWRMGTGVTSRPGRVTRGIAACLINLSVVPCVSALLAIWYMPTLACAAVSQVPRQRAVGSV
jgi:hypothetical protein